MKNTTNSTFYGITNSWVFLFHSFMTLPHTPMHPPTPRHLFDDSRKLVYTCTNKRDEITLSNTRLVLDDIMLTEMTMKSKTN